MTLTFREPLTIERRVPQERKPAQVGDQRRHQRLIRRLVVGIFPLSLCPVVATTPAPAFGSATHAVFTLAAVDNQAQVDQQQYLDDRSTPVQILKSYYNAINRQEYVRAYDYWMHKGTSATSQPPVYPQFAAGFADTVTVQLTTAKVLTQGAAGSTYYEVPVTLVATHTNGSKHTFVGCYTIRQLNPKLFGAPPFMPMGIYSARIQEVPNSANTTVLMEQSCH